ncbi:MAG: hypothetical protein KGR26_04650, partial [Cyanobacteria bacterium REEB65]|nr:hypothetical protein [Cyanobacteria bacterium REEB65]
IKAFTDAFKNLSDLLVAKGNADVNVRQGIRAAFSDARSPMLESGATTGEVADFRNRDVRLLMSEIRKHVQDPQIQAATKAVDAAESQLVIAHGESPQEHRAARGLSVHAPIGPEAMTQDGQLHLWDDGFPIPGNDYRQNAFNQATGWSNVIELVNQDSIQLEAAKAAQKAGNTDAYAAALQKALASNPQNREAQVYQAVLQAGDPNTRTQGIAALKKLKGQELTPDLATQAHRALGQAYLATGDQASAVREYAILNRAGALSGAGQGTTSDQVATQGIITDLTGRAQANTLLGRWQGAISNYKDILTLTDPTDPVAQAKVVAQAVPTIDAEVQAKTARAAKLSDPVKASRLQKSASSLKAWSDQLKAWVSSQSGQANSNVANDQAGIQVAQASVDVFQNILASDKQAAATLSDLAKQIGSQAAQLAS